MVGDVSVSRPFPVFPLSSVMMQTMCCVYKHTVRFSTETKSRGGTACLPAPLPPRDTPNSPSALPLQPATDDRPSCTPADSVGAPLAQEYDPQTALHWLHNLLKPLPLPFTHC